VIRYQLGAEELIELGSDSSNVMLKNRRPFLAGRVVMRLGTPEENILDTLAIVGKFLAERLGVALNTLAKILNTPLGVLAQSSDMAALKISDLLKKVPAIGNLLAEILLLGGSLVKFGLSIPGIVLGGLGNMLVGMARTMEDSGDVQSQIDQAKESILDQAPEELKDRVEKILSTIGVSGGSLTPDVESNGQPMAAPAGTSLSGSPPPPGPERSGLRSAWTVGVPVVGAVALITALAMK
jgi:hypothetical protein